MRSDLWSYLGKQKPATRKFFRDPVAHPAVTGLLTSITEATETWRNDRGDAGGQAFKRLSALKSIEHAEEVARRIVA
ncbi:MAG: hypothetical protein FJ109_06095 [Deltaproteobacteria bacterium]|nr:hypothetical protein [Deltaproteobacteria bacterium]